MSNSQLSLEYESMVDRHPLYAKFGIAAEAAQLFETELGTMLLCILALENDWHKIPDGDSAREALNDIDDSTLGKLLKNVEKHIPIEGNIKEIFSSARQARNQITHGFFERHNFKIQTEDGRNAMIVDLEALHGKLFRAWRTACDFSTILAAAVEILARSDIQTTKKPTAKIS